MSRSLLKVGKRFRRRHGRSSCTRPSRLSIQYRRLLCEPLEDRRLLTLLAFQDKLLSQELPQGGDLFGNAVSVDGDTMVVGSYLHDVAGLTNAGAAYVFVRDDQGTPGDESDDRWTFDATLTADDAAAGDHFGYSVSISGDTVVVGAYADDGAGSASGSAYVFTRTGVVWSQQQKLTAGDAAAGDWFGWSVSISGDTVVAGARYDDDAGDGSGSAYVFTRTVGVWSQQGKLVAGDAAAGDRFGYSVSISGDTVVAGARYDDAGGVADSGSAYVFIRAGVVWSQQQKLVAGDAAAGDLFGQSVSISGDAVVVGAFFDDDHGAGSGSAYVFTRTGVVWSQQHKLVASDAAASDYFGVSVSISGDTVVVGANYDDDGGPTSGSAYVFTDTGSVWSQQQKLTASDAAAVDHFGWSVSISGDTVVVGALYDDDDSVDSGSAYAFGRSGATWWELPKLHIPRQDPAPFDYTGESVAVDGDYMVVGASGREVGGPSSAGAAYVFVRDDNGTPGNESDDQWTFEAALTPSDPEAWNDFGCSVSISGDTVVVGDDDDDFNSGAAYIFARTGGVWSQQQKLTASDAATDKYFGHSVSISGDTVVVGTLFAQSAYVFTRTGVVWSQQQKLFASDGEYLDYFGASVSISGNTVVVGADGDNDGGADSGSAYVFTRAAGVWSQQEKLVAGDGAAEDGFGYWVSISGDTVVVGASGAESAYVFTRTGVVWSPQQKLFASDGEYLDYFGRSVSISGDTIVVDARGDDHSGLSDAGSAYVFTRTGGVWSQEQKLVAEDAAASDEFGFSASVSGHTVVVGARYADSDGETNSGSAYVFGPASPPSVLQYSSPGGEKHDLTLRRNGRNLEVYDRTASQLVASNPVAVTRSVEISGADGVNDRLTVDFPFGGHFAPVDGIRFDGGSGASDSLRVFGTGSTSGSYRPSGTTTGSGDVNLDGPAGTTTIQFTGLEPFEISAMRQFVLTTPNVRDSITLGPDTGSGGEPASTISGSSGGVPFESLTFFDVPDFEVELASPGQTVFDADTMTFLGSAMARGLERLTITSGDGTDTFDVGSAQIALVGDFRISAADGRIELAGGTIDVDTVEFAGGELSGYGTVDAAMAGLARIEADDGALDLGDGSYGAFHHDGELDVADQTVTLNTAGLANLGTVTSIDGGTLVAPGGVVLGVGDNLVGQGALAGRVAAATGSTIRATGDLQLGDAASFAGFFSDGELYVGNHTVTIQDQDVGMLGSLTEIGSAVGAGTLTAPNGLLLEAGKTAFGYGLVNGDFVNQGHVIGGGPQPADELEFTGDVSGSGSFDGEIRFSGTYSPGNSPAEVDFLRNVTFASTATLEIELGGTLPGQFDALDIAGQATLDGTLDVVLLPGFSPSPGDSFRVMTVGSRVDDFAVTNLPPGLVARWEGNRLILETGTPAIEITEVPPYGVAGFLSGVVNGVNFATHRVATYIQVEGGGWWTKPSFASPTVPINPDGSFTVDAVTGGLDAWATIYCTAVVPAGVDPPTAGGAASVPPELDSVALAIDYCERYGQTLEFAGYTWAIKDGPDPVGPGSNRFSSSPSDVWVDAAGLHLTINYHDGYWWSTEVILLDDLGYGTYSVQTDSRNDVLDPNATFGAFTWDSYGDDQAIPGWPHREIDIEDSRWGDPADPLNSQFVVQPWNQAGHRYRYTIPDLSGDAALTRFFTWNPAEIEFTAVTGHHSLEDYPSVERIDQWGFPHDPASGLIVPEPGRERFRFNLWLNDGAPADGESVEVVVSDFAHTDWEPPDLGPVAFLELNDLDPSRRNLWYSLETTHSGFLTIASSDPGGVVTLYDENYSRLTPGGDQRVDCQVSLGETYYLRLSGTSTDVDLRLCNLVHHDGTSVTVHGTEGPDSFELDMAASRLVTINGVEYHFDDSAVASVTFDGAGGDDTAVFHGSSAPERVKFWPGPGAFTGSYTLAAMNVESATANGGGGEDEAVLYDSQGADDFEADPDSATLSGPGYTHTVNNFRWVYAFASDDGQTDTATLDDLPGSKDSFRSWSTEAKMIGTGFFNRAKGFDEVVGRASDASDTAEMNDSAGADTLEAYADVATMTYPDGKTVEAEGFRHVYASASDDGETDAARLYDTTADLGTCYPAWFQAEADASKMYYGTLFFNRAKGFDEVIATATHGNNKGRMYDSLGADTFEAYADSATMSYAGGQTVRADGIRWLFAYGSDDGETDTAHLYDTTADLGTSYATWLKAYHGMGKMYEVSTFYNRVDDFDEVIASAVGGDDKTKLFDSPGPDTFDGYADRSTMSYADGTVVRADGFRWLFAFASDDGETDTARLYDTTADLGTSYATWLKGFNDLSKMYDVSTFYNRVDDFNEVIASAVGSNDTAKLYDSSGADALEAYADQATMSYPDGTTVQADDFRWVLGYGSDDGQVDTAHFYDTTADLGTSYATWFKAENGFSRFYEDTVFYVQAQQFDRVSATAVGDDDTAKLYDSALDDVYWSRPDHSRMEYADGTYTEALDFRYVLSYSRDGADKATLYDATAGGTSYAARFAGYATWSKLYHGAFYSRTEGFAELRASLAGGDDLAWLYDDPARVDHLLVTFPGDVDHTAAKAKLWTDHRAIYIDDFHTLTATTSEDYEDDKEIDPAYEEDVILDGNWAAAP